MRTHARTAPLAVLLFATMLVVQLLINPGPAGAANRRLAAPPTDDNFARLRICESGDNYEINGRYSGAYQFSSRTWQSLGYTGLAHQSPPEVQDEAARLLQAKSGWGQWPACSRRLSLR